MKNSWKEKLFKVKFKHDKKMHKKRVTWRWKFVTCKYMYYHHRDSTFKKLTVIVEHVLAIHHTTLKLWLPREKINESNDPPGVQWIQIVSYRAIINDTFSPRFISLLSLSLSLVYFTYLYILPNGKIPSHSISLPTFLFFFH